MPGAASGRRARPRRLEGRSSGPSGLRDDDEAMRHDVSYMRTSSPAYPQPGPVGSNIGGRPWRSRARCHFWCLLLRSPGGQRCVGLPMATLLLRMWNTRSFPSPDKRRKENCRMASGHEKKSSSNTGESLAAAAQADMILAECSTEATNGPGDGPADGRLTGTVTGWFLPWTGCCEESSATMGFMLD
jgi:hypothetical protein